MKGHRNCKNFADFVPQFALSLALTAATAITKHFGEKVIK